MRRGRYDEPDGPRYGCGSHLDLLDVWTTEGRRRIAMLGIMRITIAQHERGLVFRNRSFKTILEPGVYRIFDPFKLSQVQVYDLTVPEFEHARVDFLVKEARATM